MEYLFSSFVFPLLRMRYGMLLQTRLARGASLRVSIGDIADLLELSPREIEELRKFHNDPKPKEVRV